MHLAFALSITLSTSNCSVALSRGGGCGCVHPGVVTRRCEWVRVCLGRSVGFRRHCLLRIQLVELLRVTCISDGCQPHSRCHLRCLFDYKGESHPEGLPSHYGFSLFSQLPFHAEALYNANKKSTVKNVVWPSSDSSLFRRSWTGNHHFKSNMKSSFKMYDYATSS